MAETESLADDLLWGIEAIAAYIGRTRRQAYEALAKGELPSRQVNHRWVASKTKLRAHLTGEAT